jgi:hypothetical protein
MKPPPLPSAARSPRPRRRQHSRLLLWFVLIAVPILCIAVTFFVLRDRAQAGAGMPDYSVYSDGPEGLAQAAALLRNLGWQPVAVTRPIQQTHHRGLLILVEPVRVAGPLGPGPALSDSDVDGLLEWVHKGNTLLYCGSHNTRLHDRLAVRLTEAAGTDTVFRAAPGAVGEYTAGIDRIGLESKATVTGRKAVPLWWLGSQPAAVAVPHGTGRVLIVPDPSLLTHRGLLREDNAVFLYNLAALDSDEGRVYFDEYHHGIRSGGGYWSYLHYHNQHWILLQLLVAAGLAVWAVGRRLGPAVPMPVTRRADGVDYASSVARIYEKAEVRPLVAGIYARSFLDSLTRHLRLRRNAEPAEILMTWRQRYDKRSARVLERLLGEAAALRETRVEAARLLRTAQRFDGFLDEYVRRKKAHGAALHG